MRLPALEITYQEETPYVYEGIRQREGETSDVKRLKRRYRCLTSLKEQVMSLYDEKEWGELFFLYPYSKPLFVSDLAKKKKLTQREQQVLKEKVYCAEQLGVHPDLILVYSHWEAY